LTHLIYDRRKVVFKFRSGNRVHGFLPLNHFLKSYQKIVQTPTKNALSISIKHSTVCSTPAQAMATMPDPLCLIQPTKKNKSYGVSIAGVMPRRAALSEKSSLRCAAGNPATLSI
jgi:hypothetical protein